MKMLHFLHRLYIGLLEEIGARKHGHFRCWSALSSCGFERRPCSGGKMIYEG